MSQRTYKKIDDQNFHVEETRHLEENMNITQRLSMLADYLNWMRECVKNANSMQEQFVKFVEAYNRQVDLLQEAKEACGYKYKLPEKIVLPDCFDIIEVKPENIPTVDIKKEK